MGVVTLTLRRVEVIWPQTGSEGPSGPAGLIPFLELLSIASTR